MLFRIIMKILAFFILLISTSSYAGEYETNFNIEKFKFAQNNGKIVVCSGLNGDYKREPFDSITKLIPKADNITA